MSGRQFRLLTFKVIALPSPKQKSSRNRIDGIYWRAPRPHGKQGEAAQRNVLVENSNNARTIGRLKWLSAHQLNGLELV